jgi:hypothetical protein
MRVHPGSFLLTAVGSLAFATAAFAQPPNAPAPTPTPAPPAATAPGAPAPAPAAEATAPPAAGAPTPYAPPPGYALVARAQVAEPRRANLVVSVDKAIEVFDPSGHSLRRVVPIDEPSLHWNHGVAVPGLFLVEGTFLPKGEKDFQRCVALFDQDGILLWTRLMTLEGSHPLAIYLSPEGVASFSSPQGGHIVDRKGRELWHGKERPVGPVVQGRVPMQTFAPDQAKVPPKWLNLADQTWQGETPALQAPERGAFVQKKRLVFADALWVPQNRYMDLEWLAVHEVGQRPLPKGCIDPDLDGQPPDRFFRLTCRFSRPKRDLKVAYRVDVHKMTVEALRTLPPGWKDEEEIVCLFHQREEKPDKLLVAHLGTDGIWYSSTERDGWGTIWRSTDGRRWRKIGEIDSFCGSPYLSDLCGHLFVEPKTRGGRLVNCDSLGSAVSPLVERNGALTPLAPARDGVEPGHCSPDRTQFLSPKVELGDFSGQPFRVLRKFVKGEQLGPVFWVPLATRPNE